jgi:hypothetical protein
MIEEDGAFLATLEEINETSPNKYLEILKDCSANTATSYALTNCNSFNTLTTFLEVDRIIFKKEEVVLTEAELKTINDPNFEEYIKTIKASAPVYDTGANKIAYNIIIVKFSNQAYGYLKVRSSL